MINFRFPNFNPKVLLFRARGIGTGFFTSQQCVYVLILLGLILRLRHYLQNRSFWLDENCAALSITHRSFPDILSHIPLSPDFAEPPLFFSLIEKLNVTLLGNTEMVLRLVPFVCGVVSILAFSLLLKRFTTRRFGLVALALFTFNDSLIYYAAELKQYSLDVLSAIFLFYLADRALTDKFTVKKSLFLGAAGALVLWASHAALFVLAAMGATFLVKGIRSKSGREFFLVLITVAIWSVSFVGLYKLSLGRMTNAALLMQAWKNSFMPQPVWALSNIRWIYEGFLQMLTKPGNFQWPALVLCVMAVGAINLFRKDMYKALLLLLPFVFVLIATALRKYPFCCRMLLFLTPAIFLLLALGIEYFLERKKRAGRLVGGVLLALVLLSPLPLTWQHFIKGYPDLGTRPVMEYLCSNFAPGDRLVMNHEAQYAYWYYGQRLGCPRQTHMVAPAFVDGKAMSGSVTGEFLDSLITSRGAPHVLYRDLLMVYDEEGRFSAVLVHPVLSASRQIYTDTRLDFILGPRVWILFADTHKGIDSFLKNILFAQARKISGFEKESASVFLYDLRRK